MTQHSLYCCYLRRRSLIGDYQLACLDDHLERAAAVWEGKSESPKEELPSLFQTLTPFGIFAMNNAQHPMYFGKTKDSTLVWKTQNDYKKAAMAEVTMAQLFAERIGCHHKNKKVFFLDHSYCDLVKNQANQ